MKTKQVTNYIISWLLKYAKYSNTNGFVIGISGGIDSATTSTIAAKTGLPTTCIEMPIHQQKTQIKRAEKHIKWLKKNFKNVTALKLDLTNIYDEFVSTLPKDQNDHKLALANTRARLRMSTLYYFAQSKNQLVIGTGNKVEDFGIGFFTKYGDGGVDISPIADLLKSEVYLIAKELKINKEILIAEPTDGLWEEEKTDKDQIGASYPELEWAMQFNGNEKILSKRKKQVLKIYKQFNKKNQHKIKKIPVCIIPQYMK